MAWLLVGALASACAAEHPNELSDELGPGHPPIHPGNAADQAGAARDAAAAAVGDASDMPSLASAEAKKDCIVTTSTESQEPSWRETWDATTRVHTRYANEKPDSQIELAWHYDDQGRLLSYVGIREPFQHDYQYDEHGNVKDFRLSYPGQPDLFVPSPAGTWMGTSYANEYSEAGRLRASTVTPYGPGETAPQVVHKTFAQDEQGRCVRAESKSDSVYSVETRSYDAAGRLATVHVEASPYAAFHSQCKASTTTYTYDTDGRELSATTRCVDTPDERPVFQTTHRYAADGSVTSETLDFETDVGGEGVTFEGKAVFAGRRVEKRSAGCAELDKAITASDQACHPL